MAEHLPKVALNPELAIQHNLKGLKMPRKTEKGKRLSNEIVKNIHYCEIRAVNVETQCRTVQRVICGIHSPKFHKERLNHAKGWISKPWHTIYKSTKSYLQRENPVKGKHKEWERRSTRNGTTGAQCNNHKAELGPSQLLLLKHDQRGVYQNTFGKNMANFFGVCLFVCLFLTQQMKLQPSHQIFLMRRAGFSPHGQCPAHLHCAGAALGHRMDTDPARGKGTSSNL